MIKERYMSSGGYFIICGSKQDATNQKEIALAAILPTPFILMAITDYPIVPSVGIRSLTYWEN